MALRITLKNSSTPDKRPSPALIGFGEVTVNYDSATGGLFFKNNAGGITKVGPCQVSSTAPNTVPAGFPGNGIGELWLDSSTNYLYVWDGSTWVQTSSVDVPITGLAPVNVDTSNPAETVISVDGATVSSPGVVQLTNSLSSTSETLGLTASAGRNLQQQIDALVVSNNITLAGTLDCQAGVVGTVTAEGTAAGFVAGSALPAATPSNKDYFVIVSVGAASYTPPGGVPTLTHVGDWFLSDGTQWVFLDVGYQAPYASDTEPGIIQLATSGEVINGVEATHAVTPQTLQGKLSNSVSSTSTQTIASSAAVKAAYDQADLALTAAGTAQATANAAVPKVSFTAKGDIVIGLASSDFAPLAVGGDGQVLVADSTQTLGVKWAPVSASAVTSVTGTSPITVDNTTPSAPVVGVNAGSTTQVGVVQLEDAVNSLSITTAATPKSVKEAYDLADAAVPDATFVAKGDLLAGLGASSYGALPVGATGEILYADSTETAGMKWAPLPDVGVVDSVNGTAPIVVDNADPANPAISVSAASLVSTGVVQLNNSTSSTSTSEAATPSAVKAAYDLANNAVPGGTYTQKGDLVVGTGTATYASLSSAPAGHVLSSNPGVDPTGLEWIQDLDSGTY